jgi:hypothetical protein
MYPQITMGTDRDGWLTTGSPDGSLVVLHFDGASWSPVSLPNDPHVLRNGARPIVPDGRGGAWLFEGVLGLPDPTTAPPIALHYSNGQWTHVPLPATVMIHRLALVSETEGWAVAWTSPKQPYTSAIYHYKDGTWTAYPNS